MTSPTPGRPRDPKIDKTILDTTMRLLAEVGSAAMTIERVAAEAGVGKATVYRRYADKTELVLAALETRLPAKPTLPETGDAREDLVQMVTFVQAFFTKQVTLFATMLIERSREPEWIDTFRERFVKPRRAVVAEVIRRGQESGQLRSGFSPAVIVDTIMGVLFESYVLHSADDQRTPTDIVDAIWPLIEAD